MNVKKQILVALGLDTTSVKLEWQAKLTDGTIIVSTAPELEAGVDIGILTEDGTTMPLPVGAYETEDGVGFTVEEDGIVAELLTEEDEAESEATEETEDAVEAASELSSDVKALIIDVVKAAMKEAKKDNQKLARQLRKLSNSSGGTNLTLNKFSSKRNSQKLSVEEVRALSSSERFAYNLKK